MPAAVVLQHEPTEGPGLLAPAFERAGFTLELRVRAAPRSDWDAPVVVVLGGPMAVYEASRHPFLWDELQLLRHRLHRGLPTVGICLGAQLLAAAAGAPVLPGDRGVELGVLPVARTAASAGDPVFSRLPHTFHAAHWHADTWGEIPGATALAATDRYAQAFCVGRSYGVQFHPELTGEALLQWAAAAPKDLAAAGLDVSQLEPHRSFPAGEPAIAALLDGLAHHCALAVPR